MAEIKHLIMFNFTAILCIVEQLTGGHDKLKSMRVNVLMTEAGFLRHIQILIKDTIICYLHKEHNASLYKDM